MTEKRGIYFFNKYEKASPKMASLYTIGIYVLAAVALFLIVVIIYTCGVEKVNAKNYPIQ